MHFEVEIVPHIVLSLDVLFETYYFRKLLHILRKR